jgi:ribonuclease J
LHDFDSSHFIEGEEVRSHQRNEVVIIMTGSQAEPRSALRRLLAGEISYLSLQKGDRVIFSSRIIPGNEKGVLGLMSECSRKGVNFVTTRQDADIHVSGHACQEDLNTIYAATRPKYIMPVHGSFTQIEAHCALAKDAEILRAENGAVFCFENHEAKKLDALQLDLEFIDSWSRLPMTQKMMRERLKIGDSGMCILSGLCERSSDKSIQHRIKLKLIGIPHHPTGTWENWEQETIQKLEKIIEKGLKNSLDALEINDQLRIETRRRLTQILVKKPVVISEVQILEQS